MKEIVKNKFTEFHHDQVGGAKLFAVVAVASVLLLVNAGYNYFPVLYQCESFKADMNNVIVQVMAMPTNKSESFGLKVEKRLIALAGTYGIPSDADIEVVEKEKRVTARVSFVKEVDLLPFGLYKYDYEFDNTAR